MTSRRAEDPGSPLSRVEQLRTAESDLESQNAELLSLSRALEDERRRYQQLFDRAPLAHLTTDIHGLILEANEAAGRMLQIEPRFLRGKPIASFVVKQEIRRFRTWLLHPEAEEEEDPVFRMHRRQEVTFDARLQVHRNEGSLSWVIRDVTEQLQAERQLWDLNRELEHRVAEQAGEIATVYEQLPLGVVIAKSDKQTPPQLNPRAREILGEAYPFEAEARRALGGEEVRGVTRRFTRQGEERVLAVTAAPIRGQEQITGAVVIFDDVTERDRIDRADKDFVSNASHQLRNPITAIDSAVAALKAGAADDAVERARFLDHLETEAARLARIIDSLLVLSRAQRQDLDAPLTLVPLRPMLERLVSEARPRDGVEISFACENGVAVIAHPGLLEEAIASGIANAVEHTSAGTISVHARDLDEWVSIQIVDSGPGMTRDMRERAFDRFYGSAPTKESAGLGLAIAAAAVRASRGTIDLDSAPGAGTTLRIVLRGAPLLRP